MLLYLLRHGDAAPAGPGQADAERPLTDKGRKRTKATARSLQKLGVEPQVILTSPLVRARQTADLVGQPLGVPVREADDLAPGCSLDRLAVLLEREKVNGAVMVVGHEPDFSEMAGKLIGGGHVVMNKGAVACLSVQGIAPGGAELRWLMSGKDLAALA